jgi:hypothetical protein
MSTRTDPAPADARREVSADAARPSSRDPIETWLDVFVRMLGAKGNAAALIRDELEDHLRTRVDDLLITGLSQPEAVRRAVAELGETAELAARFKTAMTPKRRPLMHAALIGLTGTAVAVGVMSALSAGGGSGASQPAPRTAAADTQPSGEHGFAAEIAAIGEAATAAAFSTVGTAAPHAPNLRRYDLSALGSFGQAFGAPGRSWDAGDVLRSVTELVEPDTWNFNGGVSMIHVIGTTLFVNAEPGVHEGVAWVLGSLHEDMARAATAKRAEAERAALASSEAMHRIDTTLAEQRDDLRELLNRKAELDVTINAAERDVSDVESASRSLALRLINHTGPTHPGLVAQQSTPQAIQEAITSIEALEGELAERRARQAAGEMRLAPLYADRQELERTIRDLDTRRSAMLQQRAMLESLTLNLPVSVQQGDIAPQGAMTVPHVTRDAQAQSERIRQAELMRQRALQRAREIRERPSEGGGG